MQQSEVSVQMESNMCLFVSSSFFVGVRDSAGLRLFVPGMLVPNGNQSEGSVRLTELM